MDRYFDTDAYNDLISILEEVDSSLTTSFAALFTVVGDYYYVTNYNNYVNWLQTNLYPDGDIDEDTWFKWSGEVTGRSTENSGTLNP